MAAPVASWKEEGLKRVSKVKKLPAECMKHVQAGDDSLAKQILAAVLRASSRKNEPVKLADVAEVMYGPGQKDKLDVVRLTMDKTLIRCGIVDKIYFSDRDVRYFPVAYRFQEVSRVETGSGSKIEQLVGDAIALPREFWPVPSEYFELLTAKGAAEDALAKLEADHSLGAVEDRTYEATRKSLVKETEDLTKKLGRYAEIDDAMK
ncbi:MAG: hypothetical protein KGI38_11080 [Thaumarchaeota archaeon]|nr:hypothetical protein [Nitrososphaerota archaeon]